MLTSRTNNLRLLKLTGIFILIALIVVFVTAKSLNYARGPQVEILHPENGATISSSTIEMLGKAFRINKITLNGHVISIDETGNWREKIIIFPGLNKITVKAEDQFGRETVKKLDIVGAIAQ